MPTKPKAKPTIAKSRKVGTKKNIKAVKTASIQMTKEAKIKGPSAPLFDINGKPQGQTALPKEIFGQVVNEKLLSQSLHVYFTNKSAHFGSTKTRSSVRGGGRKPWRQKGTGRARAGSTRSPLWVGGGKALGPHPRKVVLNLPKKMKKGSLISALSLKTQQGGIKFITNLESQSPKTKIIASLLSKLDSKGKTLLVTSKPNKNVKLAARNIQNVAVDSYGNLNAFEVFKNNNILFSKEVLANLAKPKMEEKVR